MTDVDRWQRVAHEPSPWVDRIRIVAGMIPLGSKVLDVGAGSQELRAFLPDGCQYNAVDCFPSPGVIVWDFNDPPAKHGSAQPQQFDVAVCSGVLEYVEDPAAFFASVASWARRVLVSYAVTDTATSRGGNGWVNALSHQDVLALAASVGLRGGRVATWAGQYIYLFERGEVDDVRAFWVTCGWRNGNAGDEATRDIATHFFGSPVTQAEQAADANLVACGSIAEHIPTAYMGAVWGAGIMFERSRIYTPRARITAVRGTLTKRRWEGIGDVALGDPGLLVGEVYGISRAAKPRYRVGLIPHYADGENDDVRAWACAHRDEGTVIDICARPREVVQAIADCEAVLSGSLHGLIFADALGVPNEWIVLSDKVQGGSFKYRDYYSVFGIDDPMARSFGPSTAPRDIVDRLSVYARPGIDGIKAGLRQSFPWGRR